MTKKFCILFGVVFIVSSGVCAFGQDKDPNAAEVLRNYTESLSYLRSVSMKVDIEIDERMSDPNQEQHLNRETNYVFRRDGSRTEWIGADFVLDETGAVDTSTGYAINEVMTGEYHLSASSLVNKMPIFALISKDYKERQEFLLDNPEYGGALGGRIYGNSHKSVAVLLGESAKLYLHKEQENIVGVPCYVLEATTEYGKVIAWLAPKKGYNALKWSIQKTGDNLFDERPIFSNSWLAIFDAVDTQKVGDTFVTTVGRLTLTSSSTDGRSSYCCYKYKVSEIEINPDFEALGAFVFNLPDGTQVQVKEYPGIRYVWQNGNIAPADDPAFEQIDKIVEELKQQK